jgi:RimJ/RimL family protein N-acetyltransferase
VVPGLKSPPATARLLLRPWRDEDFVPYRALTADPRVMECLGGTLTPAQSDAWAVRAQQHLAEHGFTFWAIELPGIVPFIGCTGLARVSFIAAFTPCMEIGWRLAHDFWGHGYATEAASAALDFGFGQLGMSEIVAFTVPANTRSRRVMEKLGMTHDGAENFDHPNLAPSHTLRRHVLYRAKNPALTVQNQTD